MAKGIYKIEHIESGKCYFGSAYEIRDRIRIHLASLRKNKHHSPILQRAWDKYGEGAFRFVMVEAVEDKARLLEREQVYISQNFNGREPTGYNVCPVAGSVAGRKFSPETILRLRESVKKRPKISEETRRRYSEAQLGKVMPENIKRKISDSIKRTLALPEVKIRIRAIRKKAFSDPDYRKRQSEKMKEVWASRGGAV